MPLNARLVVVPALAAASALALAGCAGTSTAAGGDDTYTIVASTNVYASIAERVAGDAATVDAVITSAAQDPHDYEASAADQLTMRAADLIIENGGGYDPFMDAMIEGSASTAPVITAAELSDAWPADDEHDAADEHGHDHVEGFNEHVWYDPHTVGKVAEAIAERLAADLPDRAAEIDANTQEFLADLAGIEASLAEIDAAHAGEQVFATEPVPGYLVAEAGLADATPAEFSEAVEEGQDVAPATLLEALDAVRSGDVRVVIVNAQTGGAETDEIIQAADDAGVPVLEFSETLPEGQTYVSWMQQNVADLAEALAS